MTDVLVKAMKIDKMKQLSGHKNSLELENMVKYGSNKSGPTTHITVYLRNLMHSYAVKLAQKYTSHNF